MDSRICDMLGIEFPLLAFTHCRDVVAEVSKAGGFGVHCGGVSTMVLVPEIFEAIQDVGDIPILAAGGIVTGRQMAACMAWAPPACGPAPSG